MAGIPVPDGPTTIKLASLAVHVQEYLDEQDETAQSFDRMTMRGLVEDPDVEALLQRMPDGILPAKRG